MNDATAEQARSITRSASKQAYYTGAFFMDADLRDDFYRAYAYLRWADDVVDDPARPAPERLSFIRRQIEFIDGLYACQRPARMSPQERMAADLIRNDPRTNRGLRSFIRNMMAAIEFDARRQGRVIGRAELHWYTKRVSLSVTDGLQYFIGNDQPYPAGASRCDAVAAAHITHLLRDTVDDTANGYFNVPKEYLEQHHIGPGELESEPFRAWVQLRVRRARHLFRTGKRYLQGLPVLRFQMAGRLYCARFETVLDAIENDGFSLRREYPRARNLSGAARIVRLAIPLAYRHLLRTKRGVAGPADQDLDEHHHAAR